jgi:hypothetical protein
VFEMAASLFIEEESGTYGGQIRHSHNGYYAGDFSHTPRTAPELHVSDPGRRNAPRAWQWWGSDAANPSVERPAAYLATSSEARMSAT